MASGSSSSAPPASTSRRRGFSRRNLHIIGAATILLHAPVDALVAEPYTWPPFMLRVVWALLFLVAGSAEPILERRSHRMAVGAFTAATAPWFQAAIASLCGELGNPLFTWIAVMPVASVIIAQRFRYAVIVSAASALCAAVTAVWYLGGSTQDIVAWGLLVGLAGVHGIVASMVLRRHGDAERRAAAAREQALAELASTGALARVGAWEIQAPWTHIHWSDVVCEIHGVPPGHRPTLEEAFALHPESVRPYIEELVRAAIDHGTPLDFEVPTLDHGDGPRWIRIVGRADRDEHGRTVRLCGAAQDVTEHARVREELRRASRSKSQFLSNTSHEIRTPLNGILGFTRLVLDTDIEGDNRQYLEAAHASGKGLLAIVNDILDLSKVESGVLEFERVDFDPCEAVFEAVRLHAARAHGKDVALVYRCSDAIPERVEGDPLRLKQIVSNLVGNAVKFTEQGRVVTRVDYVDEQLQIAVEDTGIGIRKKGLDSIFEAFTQSDGSTTRRFGGTGLGLTISRQLAERMGGGLTVESMPGEGSTFVATVHLPPRSGPRVCVPPPQLDTRRALLAVQDTVERAVYAESLRGVGMETVAVPPSALFSAAVERGPDFDVVLVDNRRAEETLAEQPSCARATFVRLERADGKRGARATTSRETRSAIKPVPPWELIRLLADPADDRPTTQPAASTDARPLRVLLAEDNRVNALLATRLLERMGHSVVHVTDGALAVVAADEKPFDVVLMDLQMPDVDGLEATRLIRAREAQTGDHLPIVALTANAMSGDAQICVDSGMDAYLSKPIDPDAMRETLARFSTAA